MITFKKVKDAYGWMSNMSPHAIDGYPTAEHLFQCLRFGDNAIRDEIIACKSPMGAKMIAKKHADKMIVEPRSRADIAQMKQVLRLKLKRHPHLIKELLDTGDHELVEDVTARPNESGLFWGKAQVAEGAWLGMNVLGNAWMDLRAACKAGKEHAEEWL